MDFVAESNVCGQTVLRLVSRGNAIIAELLRLSEHIPGVFRLQDKQTQKKYGDVLFDFRYLKSQELLEHKIESSAELLDLDGEFKDNHMDILKRFYVLFESIYKYVKDFCQYVDDLEEGVFIQHTLEGILLNNDGKQLLAEALYLFGVMLVLLDEFIEGPVRERMLISYLRYKGHQEEPLLDEVCKLCKSTGYIKGGKRPLKYPEEYFRRIPIRKGVVSMVVGRLRSDDIYNQISAYPLPDHRSTALSTQACMLYVILYFVPEILNDQQAVMREIVDKHFPDNWVISYYLGYTVDLSVAWEPYRAAKAALNNTIQLHNVTNLKQNYWSSVDGVMKKLKQYLTEGVLVEEFILDNVNKLLASVREANVTMRWLMLHRNTQDKKLNLIVNQDISADKILVLILNTAQFEFVLGNHFKALLAAKQVRWEAHKKECSERMNEMGEYFTGEKALTRVKRNETLMKWFKDIAQKIDSLDYSDYVLAGRKISQLIQALEQVEEFHQIESSVQVRQFLIDTRGLLNQMLRIVNIKEEILVTMSIVGDMAYGWQIINDYVYLMQERIKRDPSSVLKLRATFLKLSSILQLPLVRINQAASPDLFSVSEYYSGELVGFVRKVLEIVPKSMFQILAQIIELQTSKIRELPTKVEKEKLQEFAQLDQRYVLAKKTHAISLFTEGILAMETTLVGIVKVDPKQLLEDGIRKELVRQIATALDKVIRFKTSGKLEEFNARLLQLSSLLDGVKRSFQYISDYINIYGLKIWQEEFSRIINYNVEQECNSFLKKKVFDWQSMFQSVAIPIPRFPPSDETSVNFIGRLARELLALTDISKTIYVDQMSGWYDKDGREIVGIQTFELLQSSVGVFGVSGLDKLLCFMIVKELQQFVTLLRRETSKDMKDFISAFHAQVSPLATIPTNTQKLYTAAVTKCAKLQQLFLDVTTNVGQMQLLRRQIANSLNFSCKLDSNILYCAEDVFNKALIKDIQEHYLNPNTKPYPAEENPLLSELSAYLETAGINDPFSKIYIATAPIDHLACYLFLFVLSQMQKFQYNNQLSVLMHKKDKRAYDGAPFVVGIITLLKQFHNSTSSKFLAYLGQYIRGFVNISLQRDSKLVDQPEEAVNVMLFLEDYLKFSSLDRVAIEGYVPSYIFDHFTH